MSSPRKKCAQVPEYLGSAVKLSLSLTADPSYTD